MSSSCRGENENLKNFAFGGVLLRIHFASISFYYNRGFGCEEQAESAILVRWKDVTVVRGKSRQIWVEMVLHHNGDQTITLYFRLQVSYPCYVVTQGIFFFLNVTLYITAFTSLDALSNRLLRSTREIKMLSHCCWCFSSQTRIVIKNSLLRV